MHRWQRIQFFNKVFIPVGLMGFLMLSGVAGYMIIEHYTLLEAIYMTVITVASVGYEEVRPLSHAGMIFTTILILCNIALFTLFLTLLTRYFVDGEFMRQYKLIKMQNKINSLSNHVIVCGFGRNGREAAQVLHDNGIPFVVLENKELPKDLPYALEYFMVGDATRDETLLEAGLQRAKALISTLPNDADNLFVVLTARQHNPLIKIISRASQDTSVNKLHVAGATNVIMPDKIGGAHMATLVMSPDVVELLSLMSTRSNSSFGIVELTAHKSFELNELDLWKKTGCTILGVKHNKEYLLNPAPNHRVYGGEMLILMGSTEQIAKARQVI
jgi:voltage-gated potassium channel